jgi:single-strand DNA-binding protein
MAGYSKVIIMGNLTRDPELRYLESGTALTKFAVAVNRTWKSKQGEKKEEVSFIDCTAWARTAEVIAEYFKKGDPIMVEGHLKQESWESQAGEKRSKLGVQVEVFQFVGGKRDRDDAEPKPSAVGHDGPGQQHQEEDVPF